MQVLAVTHLTKIFASRWWFLRKQLAYTAVNNVSFELQKSEILGFLGSNGAGKTTTIQMLLGTLTPSSGSITYFGRDFNRYRIESLKRVGSASGYDRLPSRLSVIENLDIAGRIYGLESVHRARKITELLDFFKMSHLGQRQTGSLSAGQATRVLLAKAFIASPEIVLLDEPTASLDPEIAHETRQFIFAQRKEYGTSLLITSHNMDEVTELCDRVLVLKNGAIIANNTPDELARSIANVRVHLTITSSLDDALVYIKNNMHVPCAVQGNQVILELDEHMIAESIIALGKQNITYSHISIDKPTLQDYFLSIAK